MTPELQNSGGADCSSTMKKSICPARSAFITAVEERYFTSSQPCLRRMLLYSGL